MTSSVKPAAILPDFEFTDDEAFVVALTKLWLMEEDRANDPDPPDREAKEPDCLVFAVEFHRACQIEVNAKTEIERVDVVGLSAAMTGVGWAPDVRRALGDLSLSDFRRLLRKRELVEAALSTVERRARAVVISVELASFFPWPRKVKFEKDVRSDRLSWIAEAMPRMTSDYMEELDREIRNRMRKQALRNIDLKKVGLIAGGGAIIGLVTGGLAAPAIGGVVGGWMGLSGAAAVNGGLALLGGGSLAAGGFGVAGGTVVVAGAAGVGLGGVAGGAGAARGLTRAEVAADMVKVDVLTEYYLLREQREPDKARAVIRATQRSVARVEEKTKIAKAKIDELEESMLELIDTAQDTVEAQRHEISDLKRDLKESKGIEKTLRSEVRRLESRLAEFEAAA